MSLTQVQSPSTADIYVVGATIRVLSRSHLAGRTSLVRKGGNGGIDWL